MKANAPQELVAWLAIRLAGEVRLVDRDGLIRCRSTPTGGRCDAPAPTPADWTPEAGTRLTAVRHRDDSLEYLIRVDGSGDDVDGPPRAVLQILTEEPLAVDTQPLVVHTARLLGLVWQVAEAESERSRGHRTALQMLLDGDVERGADLARALGLTVPDPLQVMLIQDRRRSASGSGGRERPVDVAAAVAQWSDKQYWSVPLPGDDQVSVTLLPAADHPGRVPPLSDLAGRLSGHRIALSHTVHLKALRLGCTQAMYALDAARMRRGDVAEPPRPICPFVRPGGSETAWARRLLAPVRDEPNTDRACKTPAGELLATLEAWLHHGGRAAQQLGIHRNTLAYRLRYVEHLLGLDLTPLSNRAQLLLALRLVATASETARAGGTDPADYRPASWDEMLRSAQLRAWAGPWLRPLEQPSGAVLRESVRVWLDHNARLAPTAAELGLSSPGLRKRLIRASEWLGADLIGNPAAQADLWLAMSVHEAAGEPGD